MKQNYKEYEYTKMPYGKYKGFTLKNIPEDYLKWSIMNFTDPGIAQMLNIELQRRNPKLR